MSVEITTAMVEQYKANVELLSQQQGSRLRNAVRIESVTGKNAYFEQIGATAAQIKTARHMDTPQTDTPHARRRVSLEDYVWADYIDNEDKIRTLIDPASPYAMNAVAAFGRTMDDVIITALGGTAYTGVAGGTATALPSTQKIAENNLGLTIEKLIEAKGKFWSNDVDDEDLFLVCTGKQLEDMLAQEEFTSADYAAIKALVKGEIDSFMGFNFIRSERLVTTTDITMCYAFARSGILLGLGSDIGTRIGERADKNYLTQVWASMCIGATRMEEVKVVEIACDETPD
jgi:hypothetical protein